MRCGRCCKLVGIFKLENVFKGLWWSSKYVCRANPLNLLLYGSGPRSIGWLTLTFKPLVIRKSELPYFALNYYINQQSPKDFNFTCQQVDCHSLSLTIIFYSKTLAPCFSLCCSLSGRPFSPLQSISSLHLQFHYLIFNKIFDLLFYLFIYF